jgi:small subunit ribosomal protein S14
MARRAAIIKANSKLKFAVRRRRRCKICGRARGVLRKFQMCRICFRNQALGGYVPGVVKATW